MSADSTSRNPGIVATLSILGITAIALSVGLLVMQQQEGAPKSSLVESTTQADRLETTEDPPYMDPVSWAQSGAEYPPLQAEDEGEESFNVDYSGTLPAETENTEALMVTPEPEVVPTLTVQSPQPPQKPSPPPAPKPTYREVKENAYWVQVISLQNLARAEDIRDELAAKGFAVSVQSKAVNGETWYRVRIGAFDGEAEAEGFAQQVRSIKGYEASYVVLAPVTRRIALNP
ncbi:MAG: SPOR domain-containing protein [Spirochaetales bacterium]|nr:SPOR domain-containing protein [Spirochaetales bacterium]